MSSDPSMPLRAGATGEQIEARFQYFRSLGPMLVVYPSAAVANELAAAHLAAERARHVYATREAVREVLARVVAFADKQEDSMGEWVTCYDIQEWMNREYPALPTPHHEPEETT